MAASNKGVLVNETTWEYTKQKIHYEERRMIMVKGKSNEVAVCAIHEVYIYITTLMGLYDHIGVWRDWR
jgi:hypothetical protein